MSLFQSRARQAAAPPEPGATPGSDAAVLLAKTAAAADAGRPASRSWFRRGCSALVWSYLAGLVAVALFVRVYGDAWWPATLILLGPRWVFALPLPFVVIAAVPARAWWRTAASAGVLLGPVLGFVVPWRAVFSPDGTGFDLLTCNVGATATRSDDLLDLIVREAPSVILLQECPHHAEYLVRLREAGWNVHHGSELACVSLFPIEAVEHQTFGGARVTRYVLRSRAGPVAVCSLYLRTPRKGVVEVLDRKTGVRAEGIPAMEETVELRATEARQVAEWIESFGDVAVIAGDFNMTSESPLFGRLWPAYSNAFSTSGFGFGHTRLVKERGLDYGTRIDHVLTGPEWSSRRCRVAADVGSDHLPIVTELVNRE